MEEKKGLPELPSGYKWDGLSISRIGGGFANEFPHINLCLDKNAIEILGVWYIVRRATRHGEITNYFYCKAVWADDIAPYLKPRNEEKTFRRDVRTGGEDIDDIDV